MNFIVVIIFVSIVLLIFSSVELFGSNGSYNFDRDSSYECGFQSFEIFMPEFNIRYYLVAILFLIFDLELVFFILWLFVFDNIFNYVLMFMLYFMVLLMVGFFYEWRRGGLDWD